MDPAKLRIVGGHSNPRQYQAPIRNTVAWAADAVRSGAKVTLVQHTAGERTPDIRREDLPDNVHLIDLRGGPEHENWLQHALYNRGFAEASEEYLCWQDCDVFHLCPDWVERTLHMLQLHRVGQTFTHSIDLDPRGNVAPNNWNAEVDRSFSAAWRAGQVSPVDGPYRAPRSCSLIDPNEWWDSRCHSGYSWAIRREVLQGRRGGIGKLPDWMIIGSADWHFADALCGNLRGHVAEWKATQGDQYGPGYYRRLLELQDACDEHVQQDIGCVDGILMHRWHGDKRLRFYGGREDIQRECHFDPDRDLVLDFNGLPMIKSSNVVLRDGLRRYNLRRNADSVDLYKGPST